MGDRPPRDGEPIHEGTYRDKQVYIYNIGAVDMMKERGEEFESSFLAEFYEASWCGYVETERPASEYDTDQLRVFGGVNYIQGHWLGFDTAHGFRGGPETISEMRAEVEMLADQIIELEPGKVEK